MPPTGTQSCAPGPSVAAVAVPGSGGFRPGHTVRGLIYALWRALPTRARILSVRLTSPSLTIAACAVIQDAHGRVLLAHHTYRQQPWDLPGGLLGRLEQPMAALQRELQEELDGGAVVGPLLHARVHEQTRHLTLYFRADMSSLPHCSSHEVDGYRFVAPEEIAALLGASPSWLHLVSPAPTSNTPPVV